MRKPTIASCPVYIPIKGTLGAPHFVTLITVTLQPLNGIQIYLQAIETADPYIRQLLKEAWCPGLFWKIVGTRGKVVYPHQLGILTFNIL